MASGVKEIVFDRNGYLYHGNEQEVRQLIDRSTATRNPFDAKYSKVEDSDWETCSQVLDPQAVKEQLSRGW